MQIKLLYINWYLVLLTIEQSYVEASNRKPRMVDNNYFTSSMQTVLNNRNHYREILEERRQEDMKLFTNFKMNEHNTKLKQIMNTIANIVEEIKESFSILEMSKDTPRSKPTLTDQQVIDAYLSVLEKTTFFVDIYYRFPEITNEILQSKSNWKASLSASLSYTVNFSFLLNPSFIHKIVLLERELRPQKMENTENKYLNGENMEF